MAASAVHTVEQTVTTRGLSAVRREAPGVEVEGLTPWKGTTEQLSQVAVMERSEG